MAMTFRLAGTAMAALFFMGTALAADRIYWGNYNGHKISFANLDGSGGGDLFTTGAMVDGPEGIAIDVAAGRVYWGNYNPATSDVAFANLDGTGGGGSLSTSGATMGEEWGLAIDPAAGLLYMPLSDNTKIVFARLDGGGGGDFPTPGSVVDHPEGIAIDPAAGLLYWANGIAPHAIGFTRLDGTGGGGTVNTTGTTDVEPSGLALDTVARRVYWTDRGGGKISFARLDGSGGADLATTGATVDQPNGLAVDPDAGLVFWANSGVSQGLSFARLDGTGGGDLVTTGATVDGPSFPVLLRAPRGTGAPELSGGAEPGGTLQCSAGSWAADLLGAHLYRAPQSFGYQWSLDGADVSGATGTFLTPAAPGVYRCRVTATNVAGSTSQESAPFGPVTVDVFDFAPPRIRVAKAPTPVAEVPKGGSFTYTLDAPARVEIAIARHRKKHPRTVGTLVRAGQAGTNTVPFTGRIGRKALRPGRYDATMTATNAAGASSPRTASFRIVRRH
jgi:DNA-binding beta-propeller fold protein YncE